MRKARIFWGCEAGGTTHVYASWWGEDEDGHVIAGPSKSRRAIQKELAWVNRMVKRGQYAPRPAYTGY